MNARIVVVDDDPGVLDVLSIRLRAAGYDVTTAHDGVTGLKAIETHRPEVILLDLRMPRMDGLSVLSLLRASEPLRAIPVIVLSANVAERSKTKALELGARCVLDKPYEAPRLIEAIGALLAAQRSA